MGALAAVSAEEEAALVAAVLPARGKVRRANASGLLGISSQNNRGCSTRVSPLHGSNGRPTSVILRLLSIRSDAFARLLKKMCEILFKISHRWKATA